MYNTGKRKTDLRSLVTLVLLTVSFFAFAQKDSTEIVVRVSLDHPQWNYALQQKARFTIAATRGGKPLQGATVHYEIGEEQLPSTKSGDVAVKTGPVTIDGGTMLKPGFLRCIATVQVNGKKYKGLATAAFAADSLQATAEMPADFLSFWNSAITDVRKISLDPKMRLLPERCTDKINVYEVSFQNERPGSRIYGILCTPKKEGRYPALLKVPGAGVRAYRGDTALAEQGIVTLEIGIHGIPVTMPNEVYYNLAFGSLRDYYFFNLDNRDHYYYKRVYLGCLRAIDFLVSLPQTDSSRLAVYGGSQGGALSIVTAALDPRIKYVAALYPALSDMTGYLHQRAGGWPHMFAPSAAASMKTKEKIQASAYYDVVNFARLLKIPGWYSWGYNDEVCPATTSFAVYNTITAPKENLLLKESGHWLTPQQAEAVTAWLVRQLKEN